MLEGKQELAARVLLAELGAALPARRAAVDFARHFVGDRDPELQRAAQELRGEEARLEASSEQVDENLPLLGRVAAREAGALEREAVRIEGWLKPESGRQAPLPARLAAAVLWEARLGEGRAKASLTARRKRETLPGFEDALDLAPEDELLFLALRRFSRLLHDGGPWEHEDVEWLRLRGGTLPGRFRLHAADLRSAAEAAAGVPLPESLAELRRPFDEFGYEPGPGLAWAIAGFGVSEALAWGKVGLPWAAQALAWKAWGLGVKDAAAWAAADFLPDEAAAFRACGAEGPAQARELRARFGDVENLLAWHRAGFGADEMLRLREQGVRDVDAALKARSGRAKAAFVQSAPEAPLPPPPLPEEAALIIEEEAGDVPVPTATVKKAAPARKSQAALDWGSEGGAWIGWGAWDPDRAAPADTGGPVRSRPMGTGMVEVAAASEGVSLLMAPFSTPSLDPDFDWQADLNRHREAQGQPAQQGHWMLAGLSPLKARLYWGLAFKSHVSPWGSAIDFDPMETWQQRWKRRSEEYGEPGLACPCEVGRSSAGGWTIEAPGSRVEQGGSGPRTLEGLAVAPAWSGALEKFCLFMGLGRQEGAWQLLAEEA